MTIAPPASSESTAPAGPRRESLGRRVAKAGGWAVAGLGASSVMRLGSNLVLTRLLNPAAFGLMSVATSLFYWVVMFTDLGINGSVMRSREGANPSFLSTAFVIQLARNTGLAVLLVCVALSIRPLQEAGVLKEGTVYADDRLPWFFAAISLVIFIKGFDAIRIPLYQRDLKLAAITQLDLVSQGLGIVAMIACAWSGMGVYSLLAGLIVGALIKTLGSHIWLKGPPISFRFDRTHFTEIFDYGKWVMLSSTLSAVVARGDQFLFGWFMPLSEFSLYAVATIWIMAVKGLADSIIHKVSYPLFAELHRERPADIGRIYARLRLGADAAAAALCVGIFLFADFGIGLLYEERYQGVSHFMKLLAVGIMFKPFKLLHIIVLTAGESRRFLAANILASVALMIGTPIVYINFGLEPAIVYAAISPIMALPYIRKAARKYAPISWWGELRAVVFAAAFAFVVVGAM
ncbi:MAG: oligosaccharide flippase family protein [Pseudomonadota bacterium]